MTTKMMRSGGWVLGLTAGLGMAASAQTGTEAVVARVGQNTISRGTLDGHLLTYFGKNGLQQLADRSALRQEAQRRKVTLTDAELEAKVAEARKALGPSYQDRLKAEGLSEATFQEKVRYAALTEKILDKVWPVKPTDLTRYSVRYVRVHTRNQALEVIRNVQAGQDMAFLARQRSIDKENEGLVQPNPFLRIEKPYMFRLVTGLINQGKLRAGQLCREPVQSDEFWLAIRLERVLDGTTLPAKDRDKVTAQIRAHRLPALFNLVRRNHKVEPVVALDAVAADPKMAGKTVLSKVTQLVKSDTPSSEEITRGQLFTYLYENFGKLALEQLVERTIVRQQAQRSGVTVSDAELDQRMAETKKSLGAAFATTLNSDGITEAAFRERSKFVFLAQKTVDAQAPIPPTELERLAVRYMRIADKAQAERVIQAVRGGAPFQGDGVLQSFLPVDQPVIARAINEAKPKMNKGDLLGQPVEFGGAYYVLKLEARFGPETLSVKEKEAAIRKINTGRLTQYLDAWRKATPVDYPLPLDRVAADFKS